MRVPNLFTVPGDPAAGFILASGGTAGAGLVPAGFAAMGIYAGGLLLNDFFDRDEDARERPERPIPSGDVAPRSVLAAGLLAVGAGVAAAFSGGRTAGMVALATAAAAVAYDAGLKRIPLLGPLLMGSCRAGSVLIGAAFSGGGWNEAVLAASAAALLYTAAVTRTASNETGAEGPGAVAFVPAGVLPAAAGLFTWGGAVSGTPFAFPAAGVLGLGAAEAAWSASRAASGAMGTPALVGRLVRVMITLQAAVVLWGTAGAGWVVQGAWAAVFVCLRLGAEAAGRRFYGS